MPRDKYPAQLWEPLDEMTRQFNIRMTYVEKAFEERLHALDIYFDSTILNRLNNSAALTDAPNKRLNSIGRKIVKKSLLPNENLATVLESPKTPESGNDGLTSSNAVHSSALLDSPDDMDSTCTDQKESRLKRNASKKAEANINKQVNQNLNTKLRRPNGISSLEHLKEEMRTARRHTRNTERLTGRKSPDQDREDKENKNDHSNAVVKLDRFDSVKVELEDSSMHEVTNLRRTTRTRSATSIIDKDIMPPPTTLPVGKRMARTRTKRGTIERDSQIVATVEQEEEVSSIRISRQQSKNANGKSMEAVDQPNDVVMLEDKETSAPAIKIKKEVNDVDVMPPPPTSIIVKSKRNQAPSHPESTPKEIIDLDSVMDSNRTEPSGTPKADTAEPVQSEGRPKRTKAKKRPLPDAEISKPQEINTDSTDSEAKEPVSKKQVMESHNETVTIDEVPSGEIEIQKDKQPTRTKTRKLQKQKVTEIENFQSDIDTASKQQPQSASEDCIDLDSIALPSRPKRTRTIAKKYQTEVFETATESSCDDSVTMQTRPKRTRRVTKKCQGENSENTKQLGNSLKQIDGHLPTSEDKSETTSKNKTAKGTASEDQYYDAKSKDSERDPSFETSSATQVANVTIVLDKHSKNLPHAGDETFSIDQLDANPKAPMFNETIVLSSQNKNSPKMNQTVVITKAQDGNTDSLLTDDNSEVEETAEKQEFSHNAKAQVCNSDSLLTDDNSEVEETPPKQEFSRNVKKPPTKNSKLVRLGSPVKQRVEQFERLAASNKAAAAAGMTHIPDSETAPSAATRNKTKTQNSTEVSSATRSNIVMTVESFLPTLGGKTAAPPSVAGEESKRRQEREQVAQNKKFALLQEKRLQQKIKREQKAAAALAAREVAAKCREQAAEAVRLKQEKTNQATAQRSEQRSHLNNKKRQEQERRAQESEERRKLEEEARLAKARELELEQQRAVEEKRKQLEENERRRKEALVEEKKLQAARHEFLAKKNEEKRLLKLQSKSKSKANTPLKGAPGFASTPLASKNAKTSTQMQPSSMVDGFQYLVPDTEGQPKREIPQWSRSEMLNKMLTLQYHTKVELADALFTVHRRNPQLEEIFPGIDKKILKRTSSAIWKTPPRFSMMPSHY